MFKVRRTALTECYLVSSWLDIHVADRGMSVRDILALLYPIVDISLCAFDAILTGRGENGDLPGGDRQQCSRYQLQLRHHYKRFSCQVS